jgi:ankyrin repeat protein
LPLPAAVDNSVAIARALLDHGADPNAHWGYRWEGEFMPWSAVCGAIGDGEAGPLRVPPHPRADALVELLLDRGADVNQGQALYNSMLRGDDEHWLRVFLERGLGAEHPGWQSHGPAQPLFEFLLLHAVRTNQVRRAALLLAHGANPNPSEGEDLYHLAIRHGSIEVAELLKRHGAHVGEYDQLTTFIQACCARDRVTASELLDQHAELLPHAADLLIDTAAARDLVDLAALLLDLGVSPDAQKDDGAARALHHAATANSAEVLKLLLDRGAEIGRAHV